MLEKRQNSLMRYKKFKILPVVKEAYVFAIKERGFLLKIGMLPMVMHIATAMFLQFYRADVSMIETHIWGLPSAFLFAMFTFAQARLLLVDERLDKMSVAVAYNVGRPRMMKLSILFSLLFHMGLALITTLLMFIAEHKEAESPFHTLLLVAAAFLIGAMFWGVRLGVLPILASVGYPLKKFLNKVAGPLFSLQLVFMGMVAMLPVTMIFQLIISVVLSTPEGVPSELLSISTKEHVAIILVSAPFSLITNVLLNASAAFALKQILGSSTEKGIS